jgi:hypothetical protein
MEIVVKRSIRTAKSTIGVLTIMGNPFTCFTLEDSDRGLSKSMPLDEIQSAKVFGKTAIPSGRYEVIIDMSTRFKREMPLLVNVPGFDGIRIHSGNTDADTLGCILLGKEHSKDIVTNSRAAYADFFLILHQAVAGKEKVFITIV